MNIKRYDELTENEIHNLLKLVIKKAEITQNLIKNYHFLPESMDNCIIDSINEIEPILKILKQAANRNIKE